MAMVDCFYVALGISEEITVYAYGNVANFKLDTRYF